MDEWNPFEYVEEDREVLERLAAQRAQDKSFPAHLLITDAAWAREVIQRSKAERAQAAERDYTVPPPEVLARRAHDDEWPGPAKKLIKKLQDWRFEGYFMRGPSISGRRVLDVRSVFALKADHPEGRRLRVTFSKKDDKWLRDRNWIYVPGENVHWRSTSVKELEAYSGGATTTPGG